MRGSYCSLSLQWLVGVAMIVSGIHHHGPSHASLRQYVALMCSSSFNLGVCRPLQGPQLRCCLGSSPCILFSFLPLLYRASFTSSWAGGSRCCTPACGPTAGTSWRRSPSCMSCMFSLLAAVCTPTRLQVSQAQCEVFPVSRVCLQSKEWYRNSG